MNQNKLYFHKINPNKPAVCFTFDDNFSRHSAYIAPAFIERGLRCTFYINPGNEDFASRYLGSYKALFGQGFEIGSHGYVHDNLSALSPADAVENMRRSAMRIQEYLGVYPATFAFAYHDYNEETLRMARSFHLETRNTLIRSQWFAIKTAIPLGDMLTAVKECIDENRPLVFSGHSVILSPEEASDERLKDETGYNPILLDDLCALLDSIQSQNERVQVLTFEQAALLEYIRQNGEITGNAFALSQEQLDKLNTFGIGLERLKQLI